MTIPILAWHFCSDDWTLRDNRKLEVGKTYTHDGPLVLCKCGLHASIKPLDALQNAPGSVVCRVRCAGEMWRDTDKLVCRERTVIAAIDGEQLLREFARWCASEVLHLWGAPAVVREYLETGKEGLRDATRDAAWNAARDTADAAAWNARLAAWNAADAAAGAAWNAAAAADAAADAAWFAADAAAAAWNAAVATQNTKLETMLREAMQLKEGKE